MYSTNQKGLLTELQCQLDFTKVGITVFSPITQDSKADFVVDINNKLYRIQCKTAALSEEKDFFRITCIASGYNNPTKYTAQDVDFYYTYCEGKSYLLPFEEGKEKTFRLLPPKNNNINQIRWAKDYEFNFILKQIGYESIITKPTLIKIKEKKINFCKMCGTEISSNATYCGKCSHILQQKVERPTREELKEMIRNISFTKIGEKYNVSDNAIRKWCTSMNLPNKKTEISSYSDEEWSNI